MIKLILIGIILFSTLSSEWIKEGDYEYVLVNDNDDNRENYIYDIRVSSKDSNLIFVQTLNMIYYVDKNSGEIVSTKKIKGYNEISTMPIVNYNEDILTNFIPKIRNDGSLVYDINVDFYNIENNTIDEQILFESDDNFLIRGVNYFLSDFQFLFIKEENGDIFEFAKLFAVEDSSKPIYGSKNANKIIYDNKVKNTKLTYLNNLQNLLKFNNNNDFLFYDFDGVKLIKDNKEVMNFGNHSIFSFSNIDNEVILGNLLKVNPNITGLKKINLSTKDSIVNYSGYRFNQILHLNDEYFLAFSNSPKPASKEYWLGNDFIIYSYNELQEVFHFNLELKNNFFSKINYDNDTQTLILSDERNLYKYKLDFNKFNDTLVPKIYVPEFISINKQDEFYNLTFGEYDSLSWEFSNGFISNKIRPDNIVSESGNYSVVLKIYKNGKIYQTNPKSFYIYDENLKPDFEINVISKSAPFNINLINKSSGNYSMTEWYLNGELISENPNTEVFVNDIGIQKIKFKISNQFYSDILEKEVLLFDDYLKDNYIENSILLTDKENSTKYKLFYSKEKSYYLNLQQNSFYPIFKSNLYDKIILDNNKLKFEIDSIIKKTIFNYLFFKKATNFESSDYKGNEFFRYFQNDFEIQINSLKYYDYSHQSMSNHKTVFLTKLIDEFNNLDTFSITYNTNSSSINVFNSYFSNHIIFYNYGYNELYLNHILDILNKKFIKIELKFNRNSTFNFNSKSIKVFELIDSNLILSNIDYKVNEVNSTTFTYPNNNEKLVQSVLIDDYSFILSKNQENNKLIKFDNITSKINEILELNIDNPMYLEVHKNDLYIFGSNKGNLAYLRINEGNQLLHQYFGVSGTFTEVISNQDNEFLAEAKINNIENKLVLLLFDFEKESTVEIQKYNSLKITNNTLILPNSPSLIEIFDVLGRRITQSEEFIGNEFDLNYLENGIYLYKVKSGNENYSGKFLR